MKYSITPLLIILISVLMAAKAQEKPRLNQAAVPPQKGTEGTRTLPAEARPQPSAADHLAKGKGYYKAQRFRQALTSFESALRIEPNNDEALGLAAITAYRLDNQGRSRSLFLRRAELPGQRETIKAFSYYRIALTYWREAHDLVAESTELKDYQLVFRAGEGKQASVARLVSQGLEYVDRALKINPNYAEIHNVKNLLHSEAALASSDEMAAGRERDQALGSLRRSIQLASSGAAPVGEAANFNLPTVRVGQYGRNDDEQKRTNDPMLRKISGGIPIKRVSPSFPSVIPPKAKPETPNQTPTGVTPEGGAYSVGSGRGALTAAYAPGRVKVEILISTTGNVVFAHVVSGRQDLSGPAILAARRWKFSPATLDGKPVQVSGMIAFEMRPPRARPAETAAPPKPASTTQPNR